MSVIRGWDPACAGRCGEVLTREKFCWAPDSQQRVDDRFCIGKEDIPTELQCQASETDACYEWTPSVDPNDQTCHQFDEKNPKCGANVGYQNVIWTCREEGKCRGPPPAPTTQQCSINCGKWEKVLGQCKNPSPHQDVLCEYGQARQSISWICPEAHPDLCGAYPDSATDQACFLEFPCDQWISTPSSDCVESPSSDIKVTCGEGFQRLNWTCPSGANMCNPVQLRPETKTCEVSDSCVWHASPWKPLS